MSTQYPAQADAAALESTSKVFLSAAGATRTDIGDTSVISDPAAQKTIVLDHLKKEARVIPTPPAAPRLEPETLGTEFGKPPAMPSVKPPSVTVKDLGKRFLEGHEVEGKQYTIPAPKPPEMPPLPEPPPLPEVPSVELPGVPQAKAPKLPAPPVPPEMPPAPPLPDTVAEVWTSTKLMLPMLSRTTGSFGKQISRCTSAIPGEPPPSTFQIPPGYREV